MLCHPFANNQPAPQRNPGLFWKIAIPPMSHFIFPSYKKRLVAYY